MGKAREKLEILFYFEDFFRIVELNFCTLSRKNYYTYLFKSARTPFVRLSSIFSELSISTPYPRDTSPTILKTDCWESD